MIKKLSVFVFLISITVFAQNSSLQVLKQPNKPTINLVAEKTFRQALAFEKAGMMDSATEIYIKLVRKYPSETRYFTPLKKILRERGNWTLLIELSELQKFSEGKKHSARTKISLMEVYIWADMAGDWKAIASNIVQEYSHDKKTIKYFLGKLLANNLIDDVIVYLPQIRNHVNTPEFFSFEVANYCISRMIYDIAVDEFLCYLSKHPQNVEMVSNKILAIPLDKNTDKIIREKLQSSNTLVAQLILSDIEFKNKQFSKVFDILKTPKISENYLLEFVDDLINVDEFKFANKVLDHVMATSKNPKTLEISIFKIAEIFELKTLTTRFNLPITDFFTGNPIFTSNFIYIDEISALTLEKAIVIYDSLRVHAKSVDATYKMAEIKFKVLGDLDGAKAFYKDVVNARKNQKYRTNSILNIVDVYIAKGDLKNAQGALQKYARYFNLSEDKQKLGLKNLEISFYNGDQSVVDSLANHYLKTIPTTSSQYNDILEIINVSSIFKDSPDLWKRYTNVQLLNHQNKQYQAIEMLTSISEQSNNSISNFVQFQTALLTLQIGDIEKSINIVEQIVGNDIYAEKAIVFSAEIQDHILENYLSAVDIYLHFIEQYPTSIYYDNVRLRLAELAGL
jgi:tetratricopeptide (TPR) repeat protein